MNPLDPEEKPYVKLMMQRSRNNTPWMRILQIAMEANPTEACKAAKEIIEGDKRIDEALAEIIASHDTSSHDIQEDAT